MRAMRIAHESPESSRESTLSGEDQSIFSDLRRWFLTSVVCGARVSKDPIT
jgi:hypothetical protein